LFVSAHAPVLPQLMPPSQVMPQENPSHVAEYPGGAVQVEHENSPHEVIKLLLTQLLPHLCCPVGHTHKPNEHRSGAVHLFEQIPQLLLSDEVSMHCPLHSERPELHLKSHRPLSQVSVARATPERHSSQLLPQDVGESALHVPSQSRINDAGHWHAPLTHILPPLHAFPHAPQFAASLVRSAQLFPQAMKPSVHLKSQRPLAHVGSA
jgi:hypothetical protein